MLKAMKASSRSSARIWIGSEGSAERIFSIRWRHARALRRRSSPKGRLTGQSPARSVGTHGDDGGDVEVADGGLGLEARPFVGRSLEQGHAFACHPKAKE